MPYDADGNLIGGAPKVKYDAEGNPIGALPAEAPRNDDPAPKGDSFLRGLYNNTVGPVINAMTAYPTAENVPLEPPPPSGAMGATPGARLRNHMGRQDFERRREPNPVGEGLGALGGNDLLQGVMGNAIEQGGQARDAAYDTATGVADRRFEIPLRLMGMIPGPGTAAVNAAEAGAEGRPLEAAGAVLGGGLQGGIPEVPGLVKRGAAAGGRALQRVKNSPAGEFVKGAASATSGRAVAENFPVLGPAIKEGMKRVDAGRAAATNAALSKTRAELKAARAAEDGGTQASSAADKLRAVRQTAKLKSTAQELPNRAPLRQLPAPPQAAPAPQLPPGASATSPVPTQMELPPPPAGASPLPVAPSPQTSTMPPMQVAAPAELPPPPAPKPPTKPAGRSSQLAHRQLPLQERLKLKQSEPYRKTRAEALKAMREVERADKR